MSLRARLLVVAILAVVALAAAVATVLPLVADRDSGELEAAHDSAGGALDVLAAASAGTRDRGELRDRAERAMAPTVDLRGGYCWSDGSFVEARSQIFRHGPDHGRPPRDQHDQAPGSPPNWHDWHDWHDGHDGHDGDGPDGPPGPRGPPGPSDARGPSAAQPPPDIRDALTSACRDATASEQARSQTIDRDVGELDHRTALAVRRIAPGLAAFAMRTVVEPPRVRWPLTLAVIAMATLLVVALNVHAVWSLRRGAAQLTAGLAQLERDPRAGDAIPRPATRELADVADGVRELARRFADARDRELALEQERAQQKRLTSLGHLVAGIAHEVRNPLTGIKLLLDSIRRREGDPRTGADVDLAVREIARLDKLVAACLGVARDTPIERTDVDLAALVDERLASLRGYAEPRAITLARRGAGSWPADRDAVVRIVDNLVRNAIDASPDGGVVDVEIRGAGAAVAIDVCDRGPGVPPAQVPTLFEPFVTSKPDGTGLGLWMSLALAEARGGSVRYRRDREMTHFTLELSPAVSVSGSADRS